MRDFRNVAWSMFAASWLVLSLSGCSEQATDQSHRTAVEGTVNYEGQPLPGGSITFVSADNAEYRVTTMIRHDGSFRVADAPKGSVQIAVDTESLKFGAPAEDYVNIPPKYADPATSGLSEQITADGPAITVKLSR